MSLKFAAHYSGEAANDEIVRYAENLESLGFDGIFFTDGARARDPLPMLAAAGAVTSSLDLGTAVVLLPFRDPTILARQVATLDEMTGGRIILGTGVGGERPADFKAYGQDPKDRGARADEVLDIMLKLWEGNNVTYEGRFHHVEDTTLSIKGAHQPHPRVWIGGRLGGQGRSADAGIRRLARYADGWLPYLISPELYAAGWERINQHASRNGRDAASFAHGCQVNVGIYPTRDEALEVALAHDSYGLSQSQIERFHVIGTVEETINRLIQYVDAGADYFIMQWAARRGDVQRNLEILSKEVIPEVRRRAAAPGAREG